jgi:hypothetical protein
MSEIPEKIDAFKDEYAFLSNFHPSPIVLCGLEYPTVEHAYQAAKCLYAEDAIQVHGAATPKEAKKLGRAAECIPDWPLIKWPVMYALLLLKFTQHDDLRQQLLATGRARLVEGNHWHDNFWGACTCDKCKDLEHQNQLGLLLEQVRFVLSNRAGALSRAPADA